MTDQWQMAVVELDEGNFTQLEKKLGGPEGFDRQIVEWFESGKFDTDRETLAEALSCACMLGRTETAAYLIDRGVDPYAGMKTWLAGPHYAVSSGHLETVRMLIEKRIALEVKNQYGGTMLGQALWSAVHEYKASHADIIDELIQAGVAVEPGKSEWWEVQDVPPEAKRRARRTSADTRKAMSDQIRERVYSIDLLRGVVMMIMLLDHTRDFVHHGAFLSDPTDPVTTNVPLFFTRWITHYCAPTFVFLSGISIYLQRMNGKSTSELARFLFTRGLWLIVLEFTIVRFGFTFNLDYTFFGMAQVIWVIGLSMIVMAALIYLPVKVVGVFGVGMILLHNLLDRFELPGAIAFGGNPPPDFSQMLWMVLHQDGLIPMFNGSTAFVAYPLIPWVGVMAAGYALGTIYEWDSARRKKWLIALGLCATALFIVLRFSNVYGDPEPWFSKTEFVERMKARAAAELSGETGSGGFDPNEALDAVGRSTLSESTFSLLSFLNTQKYPPSLLYLLMTLGPAMLILAWTDRISGKSVWQRIAITFGRVPMFFYLLQFPLAHAMGVLLSLAVGKDIGYFFASMPENMTMAPADHGFSLPVVYAAWIAGLIILFPLCYWYGEFKRRNKHWLLSYL